MRDVVAIAIMMLVTVLGAAGCGSGGDGPRAVTVPDEPAAEAGSITAEGFAACIGDIGGVLEPDAIAGQESFRQAAALAGDGAVLVGPREDDWFVLVEAEDEQAAEAVEALYQAAIDDAENLGSRFVSPVTGREGRVAWYAALLVGEPDTDSPYAPELYEQRATVASCLGEIG